MAFEGAMNSFPVMPVGSPSSMPRPNFQVAVSGCTYMTCRLMFGEMTETEAAANVDLFVSSVMPHVTALTVPA